MSIAEPSQSPLWAPDRLLDIVQPVLTKKTLDRAAFLMFAMFIIVIAVIGLKKPEYNWDMAPYVAAAIQDNYTDAESLHKEVWKRMEARASDNQMYKLRAGNPYNLYVYENPEAFVSMLPMFKVKVAYNAAIRALSNVISPIDATILISAMSALIFGAICLLWMQKGGFIQAAPLLIALLLMSGYYYMPRIATPDMMFAVFCLGGIFLLLRGHEIVALPFLFVAFLVRPDNIIFLFALCLVALAFNQKKLGYFALFGAAVASYFLITSGNDHPGWWAHFYFSTVEIQYTMVGFSPDFSLIKYVNGVLRGIMVSLQNNNWPKLMLVLLFAWAMLARSGMAPNRRNTAMLVAIILCFGGKFVTFPLPDDRTYFVYVIAFAMILLETWKPRLDLDTVKIQSNR